MDSSVFFCISQFSLSEHFTTLLQNFFLDSKDSEQRKCCQQECNDKRCYANSPRIFQENVNKNIDVTDDASKVNLLNQRNQCTQKSKFRKSINHKSNRTLESL